MFLLLSLLQSPNEGQDWKRWAEPCLCYVQQCAASPVWKVREAAAAALTGLLPASNTWTACEERLAGLRAAKSTNEVRLRVHRSKSCAHLSMATQLHGTLLQIIALIKTASTPAPSGFCTCFRYLKGHCRTAKRAVTLRDERSSHLKRIRFIRLPTLNTDRSSSLDEHGRRLAALGRLREVNHCCSSGDRRLSLLIQETGRRQLAGSASDESVTGWFSLVGKVARRERYSMPTGPAASRTADARGNKGSEDRQSAIQASHHTWS